MVDIGTILLQWENIGVFTYLLPFLLIFAVIYAILSTSGILGKERGIHGVVAVVIALMALRFNIVSDFFNEIFPRLGVGLAVLLSIMILVGIFLDDENGKKWWLVGLSVVGVIIAVVIVARSFDTLGWINYYGGSSAGELVGYIVGAVLLIGVILAVVLSSNGNAEAPRPHR